MKIIIFNRDLNIDSRTGDGIKKDKKYIISDSFLQQLKYNGHDDSVKHLEQFVEDPSKRYNGQDLTNKTLIAWRTGGMGDLCFITPNLRYIKETFQNSKIIFGCGSKFKSGLMNHPYIDLLLSLPIEYDLFEKSDYYLIFEGIIENNPRAREVNAYDLFINYFGFEGKIPDSKKTPVLGLSEEHVKKSKSIILEKMKQMGIENSKVPLIGIGLRASHIIRSIIPQHINEMIILIIQSGCIPVLLGGKEDAEIGENLPAGRHPSVIHAYKTSEDYRDTISFISLIDGLIGPDSSCIQISAAFNKPTVGAYGPFPSKLRMYYNNNSSGFDAQTPCGPCFLHGVETCDYSENHTKEPACMHVHKPELMVQEVLQLINSLR